MNTVAACAMNITGMAVPFKGPKLKCQRVRVNGARANDQIGFQFSTPVFDDNINTCRCSNPFLAIIGLYQEISVPETLDGYAWCKDPIYLIPLISTEETNTDAIAVF